MHISDSRRAEIESFINNQLDEISIGKDEFYIAKLALKSLVDENYEVPSNLKNNVRQLINKTPESKESFNILKSKLKELRNIESKNSDIKELRKIFSNVINSRIKHFEKLTPEQKSTYISDRKKISEERTISERTKSERTTTDSETLAVWDKAIVTPSQKAGPPSQRTERAFERTKGQPKKSREAEPDIDALVNARERQAQRDSLRSDKVLTDTYKTLKNTPKQEEVDIDALTKSHQRKIQRDKVHSDPILKKTLDDLKNKE